MIIDDDAGDRMFFKEDALSLIKHFYSPCQPPTNNIRSAKSSLTFYSTSVRRNDA